MKVYQLINYVSKLEKGVKIKVVVYNTEENKRINLNDEMLNSNINEYDFYSITNYRKEIEIVLFTKDSE